MACDHHSGTLRNVFVDKAHHGFYGLRRTMTLASLPPPTGSRVLKRFSAWACLLACLYSGLWVSTASAATTPSFSGTATGSVTDLSITAHITVRDVDVGKYGNIYVALLTGGDYYILDRDGVLHRYVGGSFPPFRTGVLQSQSLT